MGSTPMDEIAAQGEFTCYPDSTPEEARQRVRDADVAILNKIIVNKEFLDAAPKLKLICEAGTGINNIDVPLCTERGVAVRNVAAYSTDSVAQLTWMHILNLVGRAFHYDSYVKSGVYAQGRIHVDAGHPFTDGRHRPEGRHHRQMPWNERHILLHLRHIALQGLSFGEHR